MRYGWRLLIVSLLILQGWQAAKLTRFEREFQAGKRAYESWEAEEALSFFQRAASIHDSDSDIWRLKADVALYMHDYPLQVKSENAPELLLQQAWEGYTGAVLRCPVDSWSWTGLAEVSLNKAELKEEREGMDLAELERRSRGVLDPYRAMTFAAARTAVRLKPSAFYGLDVLAAIQESMGRLEEAERTYAESARMMPVASHHGWGAGRRLHRQLYEAILEGLREGIDRAPSFERPTLNLAITRFARDQGDYETAIKHAEIAGELADTPYESYISMWELSGTLERVGRFEEALEALKKAGKNLQDPISLSRTLGSLQLRVGRVEEGCANLRRALREEPADDSLRVQAARACEDAEETELAKQILREGFVIPTDNLVLARALVDLHRRQGGNYFAEHLVRTWAKENPESEELQLWAKSQEEVP